MSVTIEKAKKEAKILSKFTRSIGKPLKASHAQEAIARIHEFRDWRTLVATEKIDDARSALVTQGPAVMAEGHTDDRRVELSFDATPWFAQASDESILALSYVGWGGDYESDNVLEWFTDKPGYEQVADLFKYVNTVQTHQAAWEDPMGFECNIEAADAMAWLKLNRPLVFARIALVQEYGLSVQEDSDQPGMWLWTGSEVSFSSEKDALADAAISHGILEGTRNIGVSGLALPVPETKPAQAPVAVNPQASDKPIPGSSSTSLRFVMEKLSVAELRAVTQDGEHYLHCVVGMNLYEVMDGIEAVNDFVSEAITGGSSDLVDLTFSVWQGAVPDGFVLGDMEVPVVVTAGWDPMDPFDDEEDDDEQGEA
jgi:hypothetical protein